MSANELIIDQPNDFETGGNKFLESKRASTGKRFANHLIDTVVFYVLIFITAIFVEIMFPGSISADESGAMGYLIAFGVIITYYWVMESTTGKTIGKFITRTRIIKKDGTSPSSINVLGRTFSRLIPFDAFSYLGSDRGWHDTIPDIYVIED